MEGVVRFSLDGGGWGRIKILRPHQIGDDPWGVFAPLRGTVWGDGFSVIPGGTFSHALHGHVMPLLRSIGPDPYALSKKIPEEQGRCRMAQAKTCLTITPHCKPGKKLPACYEAPGDQSELASTVAHSWAEGRYIVVVDGPEYVS